MKTVKFSISHHRSRPTSATVDGILIHAMGQKIKFKASDGRHLIQPASVFLRDSDQTIGAPLSAHMLCRPSGELVRLVADARVAYHAGKSAWQGRTRLNNTFLGIEVLVPGTHDYGSFLKAIKTPWPTDAQYEAVAEQCYKWQRKFQIPGERILAHSAVSGASIRQPPKQDPGDGWEWNRFSEALTVLIGRRSHD